jgi:hypothetical protein
MEEGRKSSWFLAQISAHSPNCGSYNKPSYAVKMLRAHGFSFSTMASHLSSLSKVNICWTKLITIGELLLT